MAVVSLLFILPVLAAYNLNVNPNAILRAPLAENQKNEHSFFGYSVLLYTKPEKRLKNSGDVCVIVGAPKGNYIGESKKVESGAVYRCTCAGDCKQVEFDVTDQPVTMMTGFSGLIEKNRGWLGASMSLNEEANRLTVCAPRTMMVVYNNVEGPSIYATTMHGACYNGSVDSGALNIEPRFSENIEFRTDNWLNPLTGFSAHYPRSQLDIKEDPAIVGSPYYDLTGSISSKGNSFYQATNHQSMDCMTLFGYAITSGRYFDKSTLMIAAGAPEWKYVGQVVIVNYTVTSSNDTEPEAFLNHNEVGEFFGASLATGDLDNDGLDDLIVGAPHWGNDKGRAYIYLGRENGFSEAVLALDGRVEDGLYAYALASGDLDGDSFDDVIVAAPWEESGAIYVYNGRKNMREGPLVASQRITASSFGMDVSRFGFSLSQPLDVDGNGFEDIAVGAYASDSAFLLLSRNVVDTEIKFASIPSILPQNATRFTLKICLNYKPPFRYVSWDCRIIITLDEYYKRTSIHKMDFRLSEQVLKPCVDTQIALQKGITNFVDPIEIVAEHEFLSGSSSAVPIGYKGEKARASTNLAFDLGCGKTQTCRSSIYATLRFPGFEEQPVVIGADSPSLLLVLENRGQQAYMTTVVFDFPKGIFLKSIQPSCHEDEVEGQRDGSRGLRVTCHAGTLLKTVEKVTIRLDLDMRGLLKGLVDDTRLQFNADVKTRSLNEGVSRLSAVLWVKTNASVDLSGNIQDIEYVPEPSRRSFSIHFRHSYQILYDTTSLKKLSVTPISQVLFTIFVPYKYGTQEFLSVVDKDLRVSTVGGHHDCTISEADLPRGNSTLVKLPWKDSSIVYIDSSNPNVASKKVSCLVSFSTSGYDVGRLMLHMVANVSKFIDPKMTEEKSIEVTTEASVELLEPKVPSYLARHSLTTIVINSVKLKNEYSILIQLLGRSSKGGVKPQVIVGSLLLGLIILGLIAVVLNRYGFFKRRRRLELRELVNEDEKEEAEEATPEAQT